MPIVRRLLFLSLLIPLAGCGSQTAGQQDHADVADLARVLHRYNTAAVHSLAQQASVCKSARTQAQRVPPLNTHVAVGVRKQVTYINAARADAISGFRDCANAAAALNYPLMVQAQTKLQAANSQLVNARTKA